MDDEHYFHYLAYLEVVKHLTKDVMEVEQQVAEKVTSLFPAALESLLLLSKAAAMYIPSTRHLEVLLLSTFH